MKWYYIDGGKQIGPITEKDLGRLIKAGILTESSLVRREDLKDWTRLIASGLVEFEAEAPQKVQLETSEDTGQRDPKENTAVPDPMRIIYRAATKRVIGTTLVGAICGPSIVTSFGVVCNTAIGTADAWSGTVLISSIFVFLAARGTEPDTVGKWLFDYWGACVVNFLLGFPLFLYLFVGGDSKGRSSLVIAILVLLTIASTFALIVVLNEERREEKSVFKTKPDPSTTLSIVVYVIILCATAWMLFGVRGIGLR